MCRVETIHWHRQDGQAKVARILVCCAGTILMTFYKGLPLIGKDTPTIEPTGTNVHENTLLFLRGSEFPGQSLTSAPHWSFIFHWPLYLLSNLHQLSGLTLPFHLSCFPGLWGESVDGLCTEACSHTCQLQSMSFPVHYVHSCYVRLNAVSFYTVCLLSANSIQTFVSVYEDGI